jgi:hypothetical protein
MVSLIGALRKSFPTGVLLVSLLLGILAYRHYMEAKQSRQGTVSNKVDPAFIQDIAPFWAEFLNPANSPLVAYSNPVFQGNAAKGMKYWMPLESSTPRVRPPSVARVLQGPVLTDVYTGVGETMGVYFLGNLFWKFISIGAQPFIELGGFKGTEYRLSGWPSRKSAAPPTPPGTGFRV